MALYCVRLQRLGCSCVEALLTAGVRPRENTPLIHREAQVKHGSLTVGFSSKMFAFWRSAPLKFKELS